MSDCIFQKHVGPYHDHELDAETRRGIAQHLSTCPTCTAELAAIRELSARIASAELNTIDDAELARMHEAVNRAAGEDTRGPQLLRTAGFFGALAASVLVISGVWLRELSSVPRNAAVSWGPPALAPEWQRVAVNMRADPRPGMLDDSPLSPRYAVAVDWMLSSLATMERKTWAKPNSL